MSSGNLRNFRRPWELHKPQKLLAGLMLTWFLYTYYLPAIMKLLNEFYGLPSRDRAHVRRSIHARNENEWSPPRYWDPVKPIYHDFPSLESRLASTIDKLDIQGGLNASTPDFYGPYPDYQSVEYKAQNLGSYTSCSGPHGSRLDRSLKTVPSAAGRQSPDFPDAPIGSSEVIGISHDVCLDRYERFGAYGLNRSSIKHALDPLDLGWESVNWGQLQRDCLVKNLDRFDLAPRPKPGDKEYEKTNSMFEETSGRRPVKRTAVLFRSYEEFRYTPDALRTMRSILTELVLGSGGEYEVFLLVQVKKSSIPIFDDSDLYERVKMRLVPKEFWNITVLWNEGLWPKRYPFIPEDTLRVHISQWLPIQWFAQEHPNFDHYWNWEMDVRYTGHHYELLEKLDAWTKRQPRKGLWERNSRFYIPKFHGNYSSFSNMIQDKYTSENWRYKKDNSIWGPSLPKEQVAMPWDIMPPTSTPDEDDFKWGVGEDADLITLLPMFNSALTRYTLSHAQYGYSLYLNPEGPTRRTAIITQYRLSNRLLNMMHLENSQRPAHHMSSETWPQSTALHHGFKAVYAPHSIFMDRQWPAQAINFIFNNGDEQRIIDGFDGTAPQGEGSGGWESAFGVGREHNFEGTTWYYRTHLATRLYKRFLGHEINGIGGEAWEKKHGTYCLPPILLHPVKDTKDP